MSDPDTASTAAAESVLAATSVIIPVKNDVRIVDCVRSIDEEVEIVISLNGADDAMRRLVREALPRRAVVTEVAEANLGLAYNAAVAASSGRYLLFMDSDCVFRPGTIRRLATAVHGAPVVKGRVQFRSTGSLLSGWIQASRSFQIADHVNAYSPPLIYDREIESRIGGYHYSSLIHWEEDREFDFRLQLAGIKVTYLPDALVEHAAQDSLSDLRSGFRYGLGEGIGQELGIFITPRPLWRLANDAGSVIEVARRHGLGPALYRTAWLTAYHAGTITHTLRDPYRVRPHYPQSARRVRAAEGVPGHTTKLLPEHVAMLRDAHAGQGRVIAPQSAAVPPTAEDQVP